MAMADVKISVPEEMEPYLVPEDHLLVVERNALLLYPYIKNDTISHGRAAEILGINKQDLITLYGNLGIPYYDQDIQEVEDEVEAYRKLKEKEK